MEIGIIGTGKLAHKLAFAIKALPHATLRIICGRSASKAKRILDIGTATYIRRIGEIPELDLLIISVSDDSILDVSQQIHPSTKTLVVHTSGIKDIDILETHSNRGILYPLYSFFDKKAEILKDVPFLLEANSTAHLSTLKLLAEAISDKVYEVNPADKKQLHLAAVFANNFSNFMMSTAHEILSQEGIDKEILLPIIKQSCMNWIKGEAVNNQSGPALRGDTKTQEAHLDKLTNKDRKDIYKSISKAIHNYYK